MPFYFYQQKSANIADMNCYDWSKACSTVKFTELVVAKTDGFYWLYMNAQEFTDCKKSKDDSWSFQPGTKARVKIARKEYAKKDRDGKDVTVHPSLIEMALCKLFETLDIENHAYRGNLVLDNSNPVLVDYIRGQDATGTALPKELIAYQQKMFANLEYFLKSEVKGIAASDISTSDDANGGGKQYKLPKTEGERLDERFEWIKKQLLTKYAALEINTFYDITEQGISNQKVPEEVQLAAWTYVLELRTFSG